MNRGELVEKIASECALGKTAAEQVVARGLNVRETEDLVRRLIATADPLDTYPIDRRRRLLHALLELAESTFEMNFRLSTA